MCIRSETRRNLFPSFPPGCSSAKSSGRNPFSTESAIARASPIASWAAVDAVGARLCGQASLLNRRSGRRCRLPLARVERAVARQGDERRAAPLHVRAGGRRPPPSRRSTRARGRRLPSGSFRGRRGSPRSGGGRRRAVPVEASVAAIFWPTMPLFPMPVTMTRPAVDFMAATARSNPSSRSSASERTASASISRTRRASRRAGVVTRRSYGVPVPLSFMDSETARPQGARRPPRPRRSPRARGRRPVRRRPPALR